MNSTQLMQKVAEVAPEKYDFITKTAAEIKEGPFVEEIVAELDGIMKRAALDWKSLGTTAGHGAMELGKGIAATAIGGIGLALAGDMYDAARRGITKTRDYKKMMAANQDLHEKPSIQVQSIFSTLHRFNPDFAGDPMVAGSFVRNHVDLAGNGPGSVGLDTLKPLVDARKGLLESRRLQSPGKFFERPQKDKEHLSLEKDKLRGEVEALSRNQGGHSKKMPLPG
jgi:hypothetical protein